MPPLSYSPNATQYKPAHPRSIDDCHQYPYVRERSHKSLPSSPTPPHSLHRSTSRHADIPDNSPGRILASLRSHRNPSAQSSPVTSPSSVHGGSSRFADSQSSLTSESAAADPSRAGCEDGNRFPAIMCPPNLNFGTPPSPVPGRSRSTTESDFRLPMHGSIRKPVPTYPASSPRPRTAPHSSSPAVTTPNPDSHVSMAIKFLLSKPALPLPTHLSLHSSSDSDASPPSRHKSRAHPTEPSISASPFSPGCSHPDQIEVPTASQSPSSSTMHIQGKEQRQRNVLRRNPSAKAKEKERMQGEIDRRRNATASPSSSMRESMSVPKESPSVHSRDRSMMSVSNVGQSSKQREDQSQPAQGCATDNPVSPSPIPYYTVYGTPSEHKVTADGQEDKRQWSLHEHVLAGQRSQIRHEEPNRSLARKGSVTRMFSSRRKKATGGRNNAGESEPPSRGYSKGRSSLQESHSSMDRRESIHVRDFGTDLHQTRSVTEPRSNLQGGPAEGSKVWKLIKRISTGGMRERFVADKAAPPVPAIPKELLSSPPHHPQALRARVHKPSSPSTPKNIANSGPRPSMATSSSSPNSSDASHFFQKSHSRRSSVSSYGEETVPLLDFPSMAQGDHHIVPPRELHQVAHQKKHQDSITCSRSCSHSGWATPNAEGKSDSDYQHPRVASPLDDPWEPSPRTNVPTSSVTQFTSLRTHRLGVRPPTIAHGQLLPDGNASLSPPPRPVRSVMRPSRPSRPATADGGPASRASLRASSTFSKASTATLQPLSNSPACTSEEKLDASRVCSGINFRELNSTPRRAPLTEREKAEIWDDLLERSAQAGGTLHLGTSGQLESDNLRYSSCSEASRS